MLFLVGAVSLLAQVILLREVSVAFYGVELSYLVALAGWLGGTAAGAALAPRKLSSPGAASRLLVIAAAALPLLVALVRGSRLLQGAVPGAYLPLEQQALTLGMSVVPLAVVLGMAFRSAARNHVQAGGGLAGAYGLECAGAALGGLLATLAFKAGVQTFALAVCTTFGAALALASTASMTRGRRVALVAVLTASSAAALALAPGLDRAMTRWSHPGLRSVTDTPYARVAVARQGEQVSVFSNDVLVYESEMVENERLAHLAALQHPAPRRVLLLGGSTEQVDVELARHRPSLIDSVELDRAMLDEVRHEWPHRVVSSGMERVTTRLYVTDPRRFLSAAGTYDLVVVAMPEPVSAQANRFYTVEFFRECAAHLGADGVMALRLAVPENYLSPSAVTRAASIVKAVQAIFPHLDVLADSGTASVVASRAPLPTLETVRTRLEARRLGAHLVTPSFLNYVYTNDRHDELRRALTSARVPMNRDAQPVTYPFAMVGWVSKFVPSLIGADISAATDVARWPLTAWLLAVGGVAAVLLAARARVASRRALLAACAGFAGMVLECVMLLDYQAKRGALFEDLGILVTAFMLGSVAGTWCEAKRPSGTPRWLLLLGLAGCALLTAWVTSAGMGVGLPGAGSGLFVVGAQVSALFVTASRMATRSDDDQGNTLGRLYGADVLGGCLGSLVGSLVLIPFAGLPFAALAVAGVCLLAVLG